MTNEEILATSLADWPLPEPILAELGRLTATWSILEAQVDLSLGKLAGFNDLDDLRPFVLLKHSSFPQKLDALAALCDQLQAEHPHLSAYAGVVSQIKTAQAGRNRFTHNTMSLDPETGQVQVAVGSARGKVKREVRVVSLADIRRVSMDVHRAMLALHALITRKVYQPMWERRDA